MTFVMQSKCYHNKKSNKQFTNDNVLQISINAVVPPANHVSTGGSTSRKRDLETYTVARNNLTQPMRDIPVNNSQEIIDIEQINNITPSKEFGGIPTNVTNANFGRIESTLFWK